MTYKHIHHPYSTLKDKPEKPTYEQLEKQLTELAEAANDMLTLLIDNKPIDGLYLSSIDEWDFLIKEVIK